MLDSGEHRFLKQNVGGLFTKIDGTTLSESMNNSYKQIFLVKDRGPSEVINELEAWTPWKRLLKRYFVKEISFSIKYQVTSTSLLV
jgi:hypothetical protein